MTTQFRIVYEEDGYPRELVSDADRADAIRGGQLTPDLDVTVYRFNAAPELRKAGSVSELQPLFEQALNPPGPVEPLPDAVVAGDKAPESRRAAPRRHPRVQPVAPPEEDYVYRRGDTVEDALPVPGPYSRDYSGKRRKNGSGAGFGLALVGIIIVLYALGQCSAPQDKVSETAAPASTTDSSDYGLASDYSSSVDASTDNLAAETSSNMALTDYGLTPNDYESAADNLEAMADDAANGAEQREPEPQPDAIEAQADALQQEAAAAEANLDE